MDALRLDLTLPRRAFELELALELGAETVALVGPSGAGKTSVLRAVAGLEPNARGTVACDGEVWLGPGVDLRPEERSVGMLFQDYALFPHLTVEQNVAFGGRRLVPDLLKRLRISHLAGARPPQLSGGERQRVALARALAREPRVLLLDEPLAALDAHTRSVVRVELGELLSELGLPTLLVTHDFEDAAALAGRVGVLVDGRLRQLAAPADLVASPADPFVAELAGGNVVHGIALRGDTGLTRVALARRQRRLLGRRGGGRGLRRRLSVGGVGRARGARRLVAEPPQRADRLVRAGREPSPRARRPADRRGDRRVGRAPPPGSRRGGRGELQGDRDAAPALDVVSIWTSCRFAPAISTMSPVELPLDRDDVNVIFGILFDIHANVLRVIATTGGRWRRRS